MLRRPGRGTALAVVLASTALACAPDGRVTPSAVQTAAPRTDSSGGPEATAARFDAFALGTSTSAPFAETVEVRVGGVLTTTVDRRAAGDPRSFASCPAGEEKAFERRCPVSPIDTLRALREVDGADPVYEREIPEVVGCQPVTPWDNPSALRMVSIRPPEGVRSCFADFVVILYLDPDDSIRAVDLVVSSP